MTSTLAFDIIARDRASNTFDKVGDSATKSSGKLKKFAKIGAGAVAAGALVAGKALFDMTKAAIEDEKSQAILAKTLKNTTGATKAQIDAVEDWVTAQGKALGVADDDLRPALQRLAEATGDVGKAQKLASLAMDISAGTGKSLKTVSEALAKAQMGNVGALSRYGIQTRNAAGEMMKFDEVTKKASQTFAGQASKAADTTAGKFARVKLQFEEIKETIGAKLIPVAEKLADWFLREGIPAIEKMGPTLRVLGKIAGVVLPAAFNILARIFNDIGKTGKDVARVIKVAFNGVMDAIDWLAKKAAALLDALSKAPGMGWAKAAADKLRAMADQGDRAAKAIKGIPSYKNVDISINFLYPRGKPSRNMPNTGDAFNDFYNAGNGRMTLEKRVRPAAERVMEALTDAFRKGGKAMQKVLGDNIERLKGKLETARSEIRSLAESVTSAINQTNFSEGLGELMASLTGNNGALSGLAAVFDKLKGSVSKGFLQSLMESGNVGLMTALANDTAAASQASALFDQNAALASSLGDQTAQQVMGDKIEGAIRDEIGKLIKELKDQPGKQAKNLARELKGIRIELTGKDSAGRTAHLRGAI